MKDCLTFFGGTSIFYSRGNKFKKTSIVIIPITQTKTSKSHSHFIPVGVQLGLERLSAHLQILWKYKKTADFLRNQRLNMVAGTGLEPAASGLWARRATNCSTPRWKLIKKVVERVGFEPTKRNAADLQSAPFSHSGTSPFGAGNRTWTHNLLITSQLLYQLSYAST